MLMFVLVPCSGGQYWHRSLVWMSICNVEKKTFVRQTGQLNPCTSNEVVYNLKVWISDLVIQFRAIFLHAELQVWLWQVSIGKQWKDILDYSEKISYLVHVSRSFFSTNPLALDGLFTFGWTFNRAHWTILHQFADILMVFKSHLVPFLGIPDAFASQFVQKLILCVLVVSTGRCKKTWQSSKTPIHCVGR
jgi:hypothetical protein